MDTPSEPSNEQKMKLVLIGLVVGAAWGGLFHVLLLWVQSRSGSYDDMRGFTGFFAGVTFCICLACVWLGRWFTRLDGGIHCLTCIVALITAADVLWYCGSLRFTAMPHTEMWCLTIALATFIFTVGFLARPKDKLFH